MSTTFGVRVSKGTRISSVEKLQSTVRGLFLTDSLVSKELGELRMERNGLSVDQGILVLVCFSEGDQLLVVAENGRGIFFLASTLMVV